MSALSNRRARLKRATYRVFGEGAIWRPVTGGDPIPCQIRQEAGETVGQFGDSPAILPTLIIRVRRSEVPAPRQDDLVSTVPDDGAEPDHFRIIAEPRLEPLGSDWLCEAARV